MGKFSLENEIRDRLEGHEVHVDKRELWKALGIEQEKKDRKAIWLWWLVGFISLISIAGLSLYIQTGKVDMSDVKSAPNTEVEGNLVKTGNETNTSSNTSQQLSNIIEQVKSEKTPTSNSAKESKINSTLSKQPFNKANHKSISENASETSNSNSLKSTLMASELENSMDDTTPKGDGENRNIGEGSSNTIQELIIPYLPYVSSSLIFERGMEKLGEAVEVNPLIKPIADASKFEFELFGGVGSIDRSLATTNRELETYIATRDSFESLLEHFSFGASLKYMIGGGFYSKAGLSINRWNESYSYNFISDTSEVVVDVPDIITFDLQGNTSTTYKEGIQKSVNSIAWVRYNRLTQIDLPISLGYELRHHRWSLFGEATAVINLKQTFRGYLNTENGIESKNPEIFKSNIGVNFALNAGLGYGVTPRLRMRISARYYRIRGSVLESSTEIDQHYSSVGIRMGMGYLF